MLDADAVVGPVDGGWGVGLTTLMFERLTIGLGSEGFGYNGARFAEALADDPAARADSDVRHQLGELSAELEAIRWTGYRSISALQSGQIPGPEFGLAKVTTVNCAVKAGDLIADALGPEALDESSEWAYMISFLPGLKSAGGTEEILRNTIGERVLGLPPEPRLDKGIPFSELRAKEKETARRMNLELSDEQVFLREAAQNALSRFKTVETARVGARGRAGEPAGPLADRGRGRLAGAARQRGERRRRASAPTTRCWSPRRRAACSRACRCSACCPPRCCSTAAGRRTPRPRRRASCAPRGCPARPPGGKEPGWTVDPRSGLARAPAPRASVDGDDGDARRRRSAGRPTPARRSCSS